jgi:Uma2 family endonuclease
VAVTSPLASSGLLDVLPAAGEWTEADYYPLSERGRLVELSDGSVEVIEVPTDFHQLILLRLVLALQVFVSEHKLGKVRFAPLPVQLWPGKVREPDLVLMSTAHLDRIGKYWGVPDLAVEIIAEGTEFKDREVKRKEYARAGVVEYWIVDPQAMSVEVLRYNEQTAGYDNAPSLNSRATLESSLFPGFSLNLTDLFADE